MRANIRRAASDYGRDPSSITLVAVSKTFPADAVEPVLAAGQRVFGENYVQEAKAKWPALRERHEGVELHMIGPLQSNKAREAVELFDVIHTLDRPSLAQALAKEIAKQGKRPRLLVQVNTVEDKAGTRFVGVDAGLGILNLWAYYGIPYVVAPLRIRSGAGPGRVTVSGNINEALDLFAEDVELPGVQEGDFLALLNVGGYGSAAASNHCMRGAYREMLLPDAG